MSDFKRVQSGQKLAIPAQTWNTVLDATEDYLRRRGDVGAGGAQNFPQDAGIILVKNSSGADAERFAALGLDGPLILPADNPDEFKSRVAVSGVTPTADHLGKFCVLLEPLAAGEIGVACVQGVCPAIVHVDIEGLSCADVVEGESRLRTTTSGAARVLWCESGTGDKYAILLLGSDRPAVEYGKPTDEFTGGDTIELAPCSADGDELQGAGALNVWLASDRSDVTCHYTQDEILSFTRLAAPYEIEHGPTVQGVLVGFPKDELVLALEDCEGIEDTRLTDKAIAGYLTKIVKEGGVCWIVRLPTEDELAEIDVEHIKLGNLQGHYDTCDECLQCYKLVECAPGTDQIRTDSDLHEHVGKVIRHDGKCWTIEATDNCDGTVPITFSQADIYETCEACGYCFHLTNCDDQNDTITTRTNLCNITEKSFEYMRDNECCFKYQGKWYKVTGYDTNCTGAVGLDAPFVYGCANTGCFKLTDCANPANVTYVKQATGAAADLGEIADGGQIIRKSDGTCWKVEREKANCGQAAASVGVVAVYDDCETCLDNGRWKLTDCADAGHIKYTFTDLSGIEADGDTVVKLQGDATCWKFEYNDDEGQGSELAVQVEKSFADCNECLNPPHYVLTNNCRQERCDSGESFPDIVTADDLASAVNKWVKIDGVCYQVAVDTQNRTVTASGLAIDGTYDTCDDCLKAPIKNARRKYVTKVKYDTATGVLAYEQESMIVKNGLIAGFCKESDVTVDTAEDCPED